jgi:hypothetical protein
MYTKEEVLAWLRLEIMAGSDFDEVIPGTIYTYEDLISGVPLSDVDQEVVQAIITKYSQE